MGLVYETASHTIIFLGLATEQSDKIITFGCSLDLLDPESRPDYRDLAGLREVLPALKGLYPWFTRVWTLQELVLSTDPWVQSGHVRCRWNRFADFIPIKVTSGIIDGVEYLRDMGAFRMTSLHNKHPKPGILGSDWNSEEAPGTLLSILHSRRGLGATDPRDLIYGHLGMTVGRIQAAIPIDYTKDYLTLYTEIARHLLAWIPNLDIIQLVGTLDPTRLLDGLPSWVPDWTQPPIARLWPTASVTGGEESAPRTKSEKCRYRPLHDDSTLLMVHVKFLGVVESIIPIASVIDSLNEAKYPEQAKGSTIDLAVCESAASRPTDFDSKTQEIMLHFYSILLVKSLGEKEEDMIMNTTNDDDNNSSATSVRSIFRQGIQDIKSIRDQKLPDYRKEDITDEAIILRVRLKLLLALTQRMIWGERSMVLLSTGSLHLAPKNVRVGDECYIDSCAGITYQNVGNKSWIFVRRDDGFVLRGEDKAALEGLVGRSDEGLYVPEERAFVEGGVVEGPDLMWASEAQPGVGVGRGETDIILLS